MKYPQRGKEYFARKMRESREKRSRRSYWCDCGLAAFKLDPSGTPVCWRCNELEHFAAKYRTNLQALTMIRAEVKSEPKYKKFSVKIKETYLSILIIAHGQYRLTLHL